MNAEEMINNYRNKTEVIRTRPEWLDPKPSRTGFLALVFGTGVLLGGLIIALAKSR